MTVKAPECVVIDFETEEILPRPDYPPVPVGVAIEIPGERPRYLAWGHPVRNNCTLPQAKKELLRAWRHKLPKLFHNSKFDIDVAQTHMEMPALRWDQYHDTLFLIFLQNPDRKTLALKPVAEEALKLKPTERDAVRQWLIDNKICKKGDKKWGRFMSKAPGDIVGKYAVGDVTRTRRLFNKYWYEVIHQRSMAEAYERERKLMLVLLKNERHGCNVNMRTLGNAVKLYDRALVDVDGWIRKRLRTKDLNVDSNEELAEAILRTKKADLTKWQLTPSGEQYSTKREALEQALTDRLLLSVLTYRSPVATCLKTFMRPWLLTAQRTDGFIFTNWNQVAQDYHESGARKGARTGRLSSNPNWQNIPTKLEEKESLMLALQLMMKDPVLAAVLARYPVPMVRDFVLPQKGRVWIKTDCSQQELRILAHYEDGSLKEAYCSDPELDMHKYVQRVVNEIMGRNIDRKPIKTLNFGLIYGQGIKKTAAKMGVGMQDANSIRSAHKQAIPGAILLIEELKACGKQGAPIRTWGGREYYCEPPIMIEGRQQTFEYKLINTLIQGSAADHTKQALINYDEDTQRQGRFLVQVHDEINVDVDRGLQKEEAQRVQAAFANVSFDVPMFSESEWGKSYGDAVHKC